MFSITEVQDEIAQAADPASAEKRRKTRAKPVQTTSEAEAEGYLAAVAERDDMARQDGEAAKAYEARGITDGPGEPVMPRQPGLPEEYDRPYLTDGHGAPSPQHEGPRINPMPGMQHYVPPSAPEAAAIPPEAITRYSGGSPSLK